jgi:hypothetical protein
MKLFVAPKIKAKAKQQILVQQPGGVRAFPFGISRQKKAKDTLI